MKWENVLYRGISIVPLAGASFIWTWLAVGAFRSGDMFGSAFATCAALLCGGFASYHLTQLRS